MSIHVVYIGYDEKVFQKKVALKHFPKIFSFSANLTSFWRLIMSMNFIICFILYEPNWLGSKLGVQFLVSL